MENDNNDGRVPDRVILNLDKFQKEDSNDSGRRNNVTSIEKAREQRELDQNYTVTQTPNGGTVYTSKNFQKDKDSKEE